jgi:hypothetical protein
MMEVPHSQVLRKMIDRAPAYAHDMDLVPQSPLLPCGADKNLTHSKQMRVVDRSYESVALWLQTRLTFESSPSESASVTRSSNNNFVDRCTRQLGLTDYLTSQVAHFHMYLRTRKKATHSRDLGWGRIDNFCCPSAKRDNRFSQYRRQRHLKPRQMHCYHYPFLSSYLIT